MSWEDEDFDHEGYITTVFYGGASGTVSTPDGPVATTDPFGMQLPQIAWAQHTGADVEGWQMRCSCGWRGDLWTRVEELVEEDRDSRCAWDEDGSGGPPAWIEADCHAQWKAHIADLHDRLCPVRDGGVCLCVFIAEVRADQDRRRSQH